MTLPAIALVLAMGQVEPADTLAKCSVDNRWTATDTAYEAVFVAVATIDLFQTHTISSEYPRREELNPLLGRHPSHARINVLVPAAIVGHAVVARMLRRDHRRLWQVFWIGVESVAVMHNHRNGIGLSFQW